MLNAILQLDHPGFDVLAVNNQRGTLKPKTWWVRNSEPARGLPPSPHAQDRVTRVAYTDDDVIVGETVSGE